MKTAAELLRKKDAELDRLIDMQIDAWEQKEKLQLFEKELDRQIQDLEKEISNLTIRWQEEILREKEGRHE